MKTYFNYESQIKSHDLALAISSMTGVGAQCGFSSATIEANNTLTVNGKVTSTEDTPEVNDQKDRVTRRSMLKPSDSGEAMGTNFVCVARDGAIFSSDQEKIEGIPIRGTQGMLKEVFLFAVHTPISEPIDNPVSFVACWNESSTEFYEIYKKTLDPLYPIPEANRKYSLENKPAYTGNFNFTALENLVLSSSEYYKLNRGNANLIAIYGEGTDTTKEGEVKMESFAIVPYKSQFPQPLSYNTMERANLHQSINNLEAITKGFKDDTNPLGIRDYIDEKLKSMKEDMLKELRLAILPIGAIILWKGDKIPEGWAEYAPAMGRVIIGHKAGGINIRGVQELQNPEEFYNPMDGGYEVTIDSHNLPKHRHSMGITTGGQENSSDDTKTIVQSFTNKNSNLNGDIGDRGATIGVQSGAIVSSYNLIDKSVLDESENEKLVLDKLPPVITLKYIIKIS